MSIKINADKIPQIEEKLKSDGFEKRPMPDGKGCDYELKSIGKFRIYNNGTVLPQGKNVLKLQEYWGKNFDNLNINKESTEKVNMFFSYGLTPVQILAVSEELKKFSMTTGVALVEEKAEYARYRYVITNKLQQKVVITQFEKKLLMQGLRSELWQNVSNVIAEKLGLVFETLVGQVVAEPGKEVEIIGLVKADDQERASIAVMDALGDCYNYLWQGNKNDVESAQCALDTYQNLKDYFLCVSATIRALEGFIKKLLVDIGAFSEHNITHYKWDFGEVVEGTDLARIVERCLSREPVLGNRQKRTLVRIVRRGIFELRNGLFHTGPPGYHRAISTLEEARSYHDEILEMMRTTYDLLKMEIKP